MYARSVFAAFAGLAAMASAYTTPLSQSPGYAVRTPGLDEIVPVGTPYKITWDVTNPAQQTVTLILLRGPSTDIKYLSTIVEKTANTGSYEWTPPTSLEPDTTHYGIQLIVDADGEYQYTSQFGISNPDYSASSSSSSAAASTPASVSASAYPSSSSAIVSAASTPCTTSSSAVVTPIYSANSTSVYATGTGPVYSSYVASTGAPHHNSSIVYPSKSMTVPSSLKTTTTAGSVPSSAAPAEPTGTGAAGHVKAGLGLAGAIAGLVMVL